MICFILNLNWNYNFCLFNFCRIETFSQASVRKYGKIIKKKEFSQFLLD